jgi:hypothetical protein
LFDVFCCCHALPLIWISELLIEMNWRALKTIVSLNQCSHL